MTAIRGNYGSDDEALPVLLKFLLERTYPSDTLLKDLAGIRENFPDDLTSIPYLLKYLMERPDARTTPTVDVISEQCRKELSKTIELINEFNANEKKKSNRLSVAARSTSNGEDVLTDLQQFIFQSM